MHKRAHSEPQAIPGCELVLHVVVVLIAWVSATPLVRRESRQDHHDQTDQDVGDQRIDPNLQRERIQEGEQAGLFTRRYFVQDAYAQADEGLRKVNYLLALEVDREG